MIRIAIASGKGGTGKTMLAVCLSVYMTKQHKVVLADLDVEEPNSSFFIHGSKGGTTDVFKMIPQWDRDTCVFCGKCSENCNFHAVIRLGPEIVVFEQLCHSCYACSELCPTESLPMSGHKIGVIQELKDVNLRLVEGCLSIGEEQAVPLIRQTRKYVVDCCEDADIEFIDCPPGNTCPVVAAVEDADYVILITEPTPFGLNDLKIAVETMRKLKKNIGVVINRDGIGNLNVEKYCADNEIVVLGKIRYDRRIAESYARGEVVFSKIGHLNQSISDITDKLLKELNYA